MKAKALSVRECAWMSEECHLVDEIHEDTQKATVCLPNLFRTKKVKPFSRILARPNYQVYFTARELLVEVLDREAVRELTKTAAGVKAGTSRLSYTQSREQSADLSEEDYAEALRWFSIVLQSGLSAGRNCGFGSDLDLNLDGWQGVLKRNSFQTNLLSLSRLEEGDKMDALSAFCGHLARRYQTLFTPGQNLAVKKYSISYQQTPCPLNLALLCDISSGFICNMYLYCSEQLQRCSRKPVVEQVIGHLLRPFCRQRYLVQVDSSAWMEGRLTEIFSDSGVDIHFVPSVKRPVLKIKSFSFPDHHQWTTEDSLSQLVAHLQGWTGPTLFPLPDLRGSVVDVFFPGLCVTLHIICINTFVLHTLQTQGSGRHVYLREFTRNLASQLAVDSSVTMPILSQPLHSIYIANLSEQRYKCRVAEVFVRLLEEMWGGRSSSCAPVEARSVLCSILPQFNNPCQQDAQELLLFLLNALHDNLRKVQWLL
ncbi:hypothetical protein LDENG_00042680 [Lucifuga dentata]|nr:hypothetical protein LDENG_00042680 [Lucifuga dentata]